MNILKSTKEAEGVPKKFFEDGKRVQKLLEISSNKYKGVGFR